MLHLAIALGLVLGLIVGLAAAATGNAWLLAIAKGAAPFGTVFMNAIKMVVIPLVVCVVFTSVARLGDPRKLGRIGGVTLAYYLVTLVPAIVIGMVAMNFGLQFVGDIHVPATEAPGIPELRSITDFTPERIMSGMRSTPRMSANPATGMPTASNAGASVTTPDDGTGATVSDTRNVARIAAPIAATGIGTWYRCARKMIAAP